MYVRESKSWSLMRNEKAKAGAFAYLHPQMLLNNFFSLVPM
jgi:hypothetical protein